MPKETAMGFSTKQILSAVFFCSVGLVYSSPAIGDDRPAAKEGSSAVQQDATPAPAADAAEQTKQPPTTQPLSLFGSDSDAKSADPQKLPEGQTVAVSSIGQIDLHVKDLELTQVLQLLSIQSQRNIVATKGVSGSISADLYGVDFYEALDAILHTNGFGYREKGNFIYVYTAAEIKAMQDAERKLTKRLVRLNYLTAGDAAKFVTPLLSGAGSITVSAESTTGFQASVADGGANTNAHGDMMIIRDYAENVDDIASVIKELDVKPKQVEVEATILQARLNEDNAFGVDLTILADFAASEFTSPLTAIDQLISGTGPSGSGQAIQTTVGQTGTGESGARVGIISKNIAAFVKALDSVTDTTVLATPKILVLNRQKADMLVGEKLGYLSTTTTDTSATQTVEFLEVGTQLTLRPFISDDGYVRLELRPSISDGETRTVGSSVIPNETTQELTTNVMVRSGQTVVLGGLFKEDTTVSRRQVPYVGDIPILGAAFKGQEDTVTRSEVIFLVTPTIVKDETLAEVGDRTAETVETLRQGSRSGLLPFSRTKLTAAHVRDALKYQQEGKRDKALWEAEVALSLDATCIEAIRLKEELTGKRIYWPDTGIMRETVEGVINKQIENNPAPHSAAPATQPADTSAVQAPATPAAVQAAAIPAATPAIDQAQPEAPSSNATAVVDERAALEAGSPTE